MSSSTIPLCYPNNFHWNRNKNELEPKPGESRDHVILNPDALEIIKSINEPIAILCVVGPARSGKSYILSELQNGVAFDLGHTMTSHTTGIWMARTPMSMKLSDGTNVRVILLDTEGIGAATAMDDQANDKFDNQIFTFSALVSSLLVYNSQSVPNAGDLEKLNFIAYLCDSIHTQTRNGNIDINAITNFRQYSPDFFWLLRDVCLVSKDRDGNKCDIKTYLQQQVLGTLHDNSSIKSKKNKVRQNIREMFTSFDAHALPFPALDPEVIQNMDKPEFKDEINPKFLAGVQEVKSKLLTKLKPKRIQGANSLTGKEIVQLMKMYNQALNKDGSVPDWANLWDTTIKNTFNEALKNSVDVYRNAIEKTLRLLPCAAEELNKHHMKCLALATGYFKKETQLNSDAALIQSYMDGLIKECAVFDAITHQCNSGIYYSVVSENERLSSEFCLRLMDELQNRNFNPILANISSETSFASLLQAMDQVTQKYEARAVGPKAKEIQERNISIMHKRLKEADSEIKKMKDYDDQIQAEVYNRLQIEAECAQKEAEKKRLQDDIEVTKKQHEEKMKVVKEMQEKADIENQRMHEQIKEDKRRIEEDLVNLNEENKRNMQTIKNNMEKQQKEHGRMQKKHFAELQMKQEEANTQIEKVRKEAAEQLHQQQAAHAQLREDTGGNVFGDLIGAIVHPIASVIKKLKFW